MLVRGDRDLISKAKFLQTETDFNKLDTAASVKYYVTLSKDKRLIAIPMMGAAVPRSSLDNLDISGAKIDQ